MLVFTGTCMSNQPWVTVFAIPHKQFNTAMITKTVQHGVHDDLGDVRAASDTISLLKNTSLSAQLCFSAWDLFFFALPG